MLQLPIAVLLALEIRLSSARKANRLLYRVAGLSLLLTILLDVLFMRWWGWLESRWPASVLGLFRVCIFLVNLPVRARLPLELPGTIA